MAKRGNEIKDLKQKLDNMVKEKEQARLEAKNSDVTLKLKQQIKEEIEQEMMEKFDLDQYNITSDDLRSESQKFV